MRTSDKYGAAGEGLGHDLGLAMLVRRQEVEREDLEVELPAVSGEDDRNGDSHRRPQGGVHLGGRSAS